MGPHCWIWCECSLKPGYFCVCVKNVKFHFYADDTILYASSASLESAIDKLQTAFNVVQRNLFSLKLVLNAQKTKTMYFSRARPKLQDNILISTLKNEVVERVSTYKYLGFLLEENLSFNQHIVSLTKKLRVKLGFFYRNKRCFSFVARKKLIQATFLSVIDYGDILYMLLQLL